jgi:hypothetical protein
LFEPEAGLTVSHVCELETVHATLDVTEKVAVLAAAVTLNVAGLTDNVLVEPATACVTVTVCAVTPVPEIVTVADRVDVPVFACAVTVTVALFEPDAGLTVNHVWLLVTVQAILEVTLNVAVLLAAAATPKLVVETEIVLTGVPNVDHALYQLA